MLTQAFRDTIRTRARRDPRVRRALSTEAVTELWAGDLAVSKALPRDYINATIGFELLGIEMYAAPLTWNLPPVVSDNATIAARAQPGGAPDVVHLHEPAASARVDGCALGVAPCARSIHSNACR